MGVINHLMSSLAGWPALAIVFLVPALEASIFVGFVFPGETAVVLGGVLAGQGYMPIWAVVVSAVAGAIIGDSVGYLVGLRWGEWLVDHTVGHVVKEVHIDRARSYVARKGGVAVFLGRWTAILRALVPATAGMSDMTYRTFLPWNVAGGAVWATTFALVGWGAGNSWHSIVHAVNVVGLGVVGALAAALVVVMVVRRRRHRGRIEADVSGAPSSAPGSS